MTEELTITVVECEKGHKSRYLGKVKIRKNYFFCSKCTEQGAIVNYDVKTFIPKGSEAKMIFEELNKLKKQCKAHYDKEKYVVINRSFFNKFKKEFGDEK